jgi:pimeloyl-ACP methyl ester carboxylesterase
MLLHGFTHDSREWRPQLQSLADQFTVIAWDAPGAGQSVDPPGDLWDRRLGGLSPPGYSTPSALLGPLMEALIGPEARMRFRNGRQPTMSRRRARSITVIAVGTPPPLPLRPFAAEVLRMLDANQAAEREAKRMRQED